MAADKASDQKQKRRAARGCWRGVEYTLCCAVYLSAARRVGGSRRPPPTAPSSAIHSWGSEQGRVRQEGFGPDTFIKTLHQGRRGRWGGQRAKRASIATSAVLPARAPPASHRPRSGCSRGRLPAACLTGSGCTALNTLHFNAGRGLRGCCRAVLCCACCAQARGPAARMRCASSAVTWPPPSSNFLKFCSQERNQAEASIGQQLS